MAVRWEVYGCPGISLVCTCISIYWITLHVIITWVWEIAILNNGCFSMLSLFLKDFIVEKTLDVLLMLLSVTFLMSYWTQYQVA